MQTWVRFVFALVIFAPVFMAAQNQPASAKHRQNTQQSNPAPPINVNCNCTTQTDDSKNKPQGWHKLIAWPEGIATWALIATLGIIFWQTVEVHRSVNVAKKSADAALRSSDGLINAERPWLGTTVEKRDSMVRYEFGVKNLGRTPALVIGVSTMRLTANDLPEVPDYMPQVADSERSMEESGNLYLLAPGEYWRFKTIDFSSHYPGGQFRMDELEDIGKGNRKLFFYGKVRYRDVFDPKTVHETHFCYVYKGDEFVRSGQKGYNKYT